MKDRLVANVKRVTTAYLVAVGLVAHALAVSAWLTYPEHANKAWRLAGEAWEKLPGLTPAMKAEAAPQLPLHEEIASNFSPWLPLDYSGEILPGEIRIGTRVYRTLPDAAKALKDNDLLEIGAGLYRTGFVVKADNVTILGRGHVVLEKAAVQGKAAIVIEGNNTTLKNIECRFIKVKHGNGACIRLAGSDLTLQGVFFHDSQQGVLTGKTPGTVQILNSRFENLGHRGRAHGIYIGGGNLIIDGSLFLAAKDQGHEIKSRSATTVITKSVIASFSSRNSRLVDISNGGVLSISHSILAQGPKSSNQDAIGFGLGGYRYERNEVSLKGNIILLERQGPNVLFHAGQPSSGIKLTGNTIIGREFAGDKDNNRLFNTRAEAGLPAYPQLPDINQQAGK